VLVRMPYTGVVRVSEIAGHAAPEPVKRLAGPPQRAPRLPPENPCIRLTMTDKP
jgi:hypothetical protein